MMNGNLGEIPAGSRRRLLAHYGPAAGAWLDTVPELLERAANRWQLQLGDYHDAGHASVIATAASRAGRPLLLKAWTDPARYRHEVATLRLWADGPVVSVVDAADDLAIAALERVGGRVGGAARPESELRRVAAALRGLHSIGQRARRPGGLPGLADYLDQVIRPRIERRVSTMDLEGWGPLVETGLSAFAHLERGTGDATVLHADLYRENVLFDERGHPQLIDPLPMVGDPAFDWAFWTVYYDLGHGTAQRLAMASRVSRIPVPVLAPWCRLLATDGLLFYAESGDPRAPRMADVLTHLLATTAWSGT